VTASDQQRQQRIDRLTAAARRRTRQAEQHAEKTIRRMLRDRDAITFRGIHRRAGLSLDFLYTNPTIRARIHAAKHAQNSRGAAQPAPVSADSSEGTLVRVLTAQLQAAKRKHCHDSDELRRQMAAATGEILALRERIRVLESFDHARNAQPGSGTRAVGDDTGPALR
jgi:hypothetical protein